MAKEIERKFLITSDAWRFEAGSGIRMRQAVILTQDRHMMRVRLYGDGRARLTVKVGIDALRRHEFEYDIPPEDAAEMLSMALGSEIAKTRYEIHHGRHVWEIDCFEGALEGLVIAEVEMEEEDLSPDLPDWLGREVTDDPRFTNQALAEGSLGENWRDVLSV
ncbi:CYTH domain-containing protein [Rhizobium alvei]|uniref:CYTH domain-containing protein n=1 Tax=Rhizobium alvei TaxID=1132659 RepID=A0ABT8YLQ8_9HYPH|nr:CYTH domain-containing protein [Rhizobium alvei]MDO6964268.1 CYTH domain-containing protein [Rhizobium alvei]